jgi:arabinogalactan endo-1,4-beta-galactosidase
MNPLTKGLLIGLCGFLFAAGASRAADFFAFGADLSFLKQAEDNGKVFKDGTNAMPGLQIFRDHGYNWIRLRIFVEPVGQHLPNDLKYTLAMAQAAKKLGYKFLLDFHYTSTWADPGKQPTPKQWQAMSHAERVEAVFAYTRDTIAALRDGGVLPDMVQIGNEVSNGMLWPDGQLPDNWDHFAAYIYAGINGVDAGRGNGPRPKIMIHVDYGGAKDKTKWFFDKLNSYGVPYDVIGFSYYPRWQGTLMDLRETLAFAANEYGKDIIVVETGHNWKPIPATSDRPQPFPTTPEGQRDFLDEVTRVVMNVPGGHGKGVFWWEPAASRNIDGRSFFDDDGNSLPVLNVFDKYTRPVLKKGAQ